jgi:hypothetical protein
MAVGCEPSDPGDDTFMGTYGAGQADAKTASLPAAAASIAPKAMPFRWRIVGALDFLRHDPCHARAGWSRLWVREALGRWIVAGALSGVGRIEAQTIQLGLSPPDYGECGAVSVNGGVSTANGQIVRKAILSGASERTSETAEPNRRW